MQEEWKDLNIIDDDDIEDNDRINILKTCMYTEKSVLSDKWDYGTLDHSHYFDKHKTINIKFTFLIKI